MFKIISIAGRNYSMVGGCKYKAKEVRITNNNEFYETVREKLIFTAEERRAVLHAEAQSKAETCKPRTA